MRHVRRNGPGLGSGIGFRVGRVCQQPSCKPASLRPPCPSPFLVSRSLSPCPACLRAPFACTCVSVRVHACVHMWLHVSVCVFVCVCVCVTAGIERPWLCGQSMRGHTAMQPMPSTSSHGLPLSCACTGMCCAHTHENKACWSSDKGDGGEQIRGGSRHGGTRHGA